jgi:hypothetical protein
LAHALWGGGTLARRHRFLSKRWLHGLAVTRDFSQLMLIGCLRIRWQTSQVW